MTKQERLVKIAMAKARAFGTGGTKELVGCLTPCEILALIKAGARLADGNKKWLKEAQDTAQADKKAGICNPNWFYFVMPA